MDAKQESKLDFTEEEKNFIQYNRDTYNSGQGELALQQAIEFYQLNPNSLVAKFHYGVNAGDYSYSPSLPLARREELLYIAKKIIKEIYESGEGKRYPDQFYSSICNEYFWFYKLHEEQYHLGLQDVQRGLTRGYYSQCVGASSMALKCLLELDSLPLAEEWANKSIGAFIEFEKIDPLWYNINEFYAEALAVLGHYDEAILAYKDLYRKQGVSAREEALAAFKEKIEPIKLKRNKLKT